QAVHQPPVCPIQPEIDGDVTSYFEWMGAGMYRVDGRGGAMHGQRFLVKEVYYGSNSDRFFLRVDFLESEAALLPGMEVRVTINGKIIIVRLDDPVELIEGSELGVEVAFHKLLELSVPLPKDVVRLQISVWQMGLPMDALPQEGHLEIPLSDVTE